MGLIDLWALEHPKAGVFPDIKNAATPYYCVKDSHDIKAFQLDKPPNFEADGHPSHERYHHHFRVVISFALFPNETFFHNSPSLFLGEYSHSLAS